MPPTTTARLRLRPAFTGDGSGKLHLTLTKKATLCGVALPAKSLAVDGDKYGRWFNDDGCRSCAKEARKLERGCTRCPAILFTPDHVRRGLCPACHRKRRTPKLRPSQVAAQREAAKQAKQAEKQARAPWSTWPPSVPLIIDDWRHRPMVTEFGQIDRILDLQRAFDQLDQHLMADPRPAPPEITIGRQPTNQGQRYTFHHPAVGWLGEVQLVIAFGGGLQLRLFTAGHPDDPMSATRTAMLQPMVDQLIPRLETSDSLPPPPVQGFIPSITPRQSYHDPERLRVRDYHCTRCDAVVARLVLADGVLEDAIRQALCERPAPTMPVWVVALAVGEGEEETRICPVVQIIPTRSAVSALTAPDFEKQIRRMRLAHCRPRTIVP